MKSPAREGQASVMVVQLAFRHSPACRSAEFDAGQLHSCFGGAHGAHFNLSRRRALAL
jgi:hypothetical protein